MTAPKRNGNEPDEYKPGETLVLDEDLVMETSEFRKFVVPELDLLEDIEPPDLDD
jgi:hypothetical protein